MALGLTRAALERDLLKELGTAADGLGPQATQEIARVLATIIERNNREIERELGRRFADIERMIGRR